MLRSLNISNFAVFEKETINFEDGFNVFTGETGSGKSVLIDALSFILGGRASKNLIRKGKKSALVEGIFDITNNIKLNYILKEQNLEIDESDFLIITRELLENGKNISKINGKTVPLNTIKLIGSYLIDIYGQSEHESLYKKENHIFLLDSLVYKELEPILQEYNNFYKDYNKKCEEIKFLEEKLINKDLKIEQLQFEINEIDEASLTEFEEENLLKEIKKLTNVQEIKNSLYEINNELSHNDNSCLNILNNVYKILNKLRTYDEGLGDFLNKLEPFTEELQYLVYDLINYSDNLDVDEERLLFVENRVSLINRLKRKYGFSIDKIIEYRELSEKELIILKEAENKLNNLNKEKNNLYKHLKENSEKISQLRKKAADYLEKQILTELNDLNMKNIKFKVNINNKKDYSSDGIDDVEFLISTNLGSDLNSVQKVISGGEASRIMLALKKISSDLDDTDTFIFDEIDTGISGKTAQMAGIKMNYISSKHQIICVTHSPQIASISKNHYLIEKKIADNNTYSKVKKLNEETKVYEIARLLSGMKITEISLSNAKELIHFSNNI